MATAASTINADILDRLRSPDALMVSNATPPTTLDGQNFVYAMMTVAERFVNLAERQVVNAFSLALTANVAIYDLTTSGPADFFGKVLAITAPTVGEIDGPVDYRAFGRAARNWLVANGTRLTGWGQIGRTLLGIVPTFAAAPPTVTMRYIAATPVLNNASNLAVSDDTAEHVSRLAELILRIKTRQLTDFDARLKMLAEDMNVRGVGGQPSMKSDGEAATLVPPQPQTIGGKAV